MHAAAVSTASRCCALASLQSDVLVTAGALRHAEAGSELTRIAAWTIGHLAAGVKAAAAMPWGSDRDVLIAALTAAEARRKDQHGTVEAVRGALRAMGAL